MVGLTQQRIKTHNKECTVNNNLKETLDKITLTQMQKDVKSLSYFCIKRITKYNMSLSLSSVSLSMIRHGYEHG